MRKISGQLLSSKPVSLSRAAKLITRFAAVDNGSSPTVSLYLQRTADAFNHLVQFHNKRSRTGDVESSPDRKRARKSDTDKLEKKISVEKTGRDSKGKGKKEREDDETNANESEVKDLKFGAQYWETSKLEKNPDRKTTKDSKNRGKKDRKTGNEAAEVNPNENEVKDLMSEEKEQRKEEKKKKKRKIHGDDSSETKRIVDGVDS